jgi:hypothetical protein
VIPYDVIITSVHDRADLLERTLRSMIPRLDQKPARVIVHEDARPGREVVEGRTEAILAAVQRDTGVPIELIATRPSTGLSLALLRLLEAASTEFVFYTQEDFDFVRDVPVARCLQIMQRHALNHVRFNKRDTLAIKGAHRARSAWWTKKEAFYDGQPFCISDHFYFQANLTRRALILEGFKQLIYDNPAGLVRCEAKFNHWANTRYGDGAGSVDGNGNHEKRRDLLRTFIWGGVGEPRFILHTGALRRSQEWMDPAHDLKHGTVMGEKR